MISQAKQPMDFLLSGKQKQIADMEAEVTRLGNQPNASSGAAKDRLDEIKVRLAASKGEHEAIRNLIEQIKK